MDNLFIKKRSVKIVMIILVFLTLFNFMYLQAPVFAAPDNNSSATASSNSSSTSNDDSESSAMEAVGGVLLEPLIKLICTLGEGVIYVIQMNVLGLPSTIYVPKEGAVKTMLSSIGTLTSVGLFTGMKIGGLAGGHPVIGALIGAGAGAVGGTVSGALELKDIPGDFYFPMYRISPQEIFQGDIPALDVNFISPSKSVFYDENGKLTDGYKQKKDTDNHNISGAYEKNGVTVYNSAEALSPQIARWYVAIRNMVLVGLMVVLLYIGIRIVISSASSEKAKYKENIKDWLIAVILVVFMHYIMAFALTVTEYLTSMLSSQDETISFKIDEKLANRLLGFSDEKSKGETEENAKDDLKNALNNSKAKNGDSTYTIQTNLMGYARLKQQINERGTDNKFSWNYIGYAIIYLVLVIYTVMFLIIYFKRVIYMAFLTMIAPLVALTYPLDKLSDGQAQAFNMWLREYIYNLLLQPFHLLLYTMLIGSVMDLATNNMIYALVVLGFLVPAEKILRRFFGFEKAQGPGNLMGSVVGGSLAMEAVRKVSGLGPPPPPKGKKGDKGTADDGKIHLSDRKADAGIATGNEAIVNAFGGNDGNTEIAGSNIKVGENIGNSIKDKEEIDDSAEIGKDIGKNINLGESKKPEMAILSRKYTPVSGSEATQMFNNAKVTPELGKESMNANKADLNTSKSPKIDTKNVNIGSMNGGIRTKPKLVKPKVEDSRGKKILKNIGAGASVAGHYAVRGAAAAAKRVPGVAAKAAFGATMATVGVAAGLASGDLNKAAQYGAAGAVAGANLGKNVSSGIIKATDTIRKDAAPAVQDRYLKKRYKGDELKAHQNEIADKRFMNDKKVQERLKEEYGSKWKEKRKEVLQYRKAGHVDLESTISAMNMKGDVPQAERIEYAKASAKIQKDPAKLDAYMKTLEQNGITEGKRKEVRQNLVNMNKI